MLGDVIDHGVGHGRERRLAQTVGEPIGHDRADLRKGTRAARLGRLPCASGRSVTIQRGEELGHAFAGRSGRDEHLGTFR
jgi:hypothetical protein